VNISWNDAISFCNLLSQNAGLEECYSISNDGENIICDWESNGYRFPSDYTGNAIWLKTSTSKYKVGQKVRYWVGDSVNTSFPAHAVARKIEIIK
jgi:hypothetical protein